jgi:hypothetical protein
MHPRVSGCVFLGSGDVEFLEILLFPMGSHELPNMFLKFSMCSQ